MDPVAMQLSKYLHDVICDPGNAVLDLQKLPEGFRDFALTHSSNLLGFITGQISQWIIVTDRNTAKWLLVSQKADKILSDPKCKSLLARWLAQQTKSMARQNQVRTTELELPNHIGTQYFSVTIHPMYRQYRHKCSALAFVFTDISKEREHLKSLQNIVNYDMMTQTYNRRYGMAVLNKWLSEGKSFILCFVDIDNLKYVNDRFGHAEGDRYILSIVEILREFSSDATVCRVGGDEFMLLAQNWSVDAAGERLELLQNRLWRSNDNAADVHYHRSMSYGLIEAGAGSTSSASDLLRTADERMYEYKHAHKMR